MEEKLSPRRRLYDRGLRALLYLCGLLVCALLVFLIGYIFYRGVPGITWSLLTSQTSYIKNTVGILPNILDTLYIIVVAMVIVLPLGVGAAIYLTEYASNRRLVSVIEFATETLTGIPSIIFGLVGMLLFVQRMNLQAGILAGGLTLVVMILPTIVRTTQESLKTVPQSYREGALGLGAGKWHMIRTVVLPGAVDGIVTGCILAVGRIVGESAALLFTAGAAEVIAKGVVKAYTSNGATLSVLLYLRAFEDGDFASAWGIGAVLLVLVLIIGQVVFSGVMFSMTGALTAISYIIVCRWGMGALGASTDLNDRLSWLKAGLDSPMYDATVPNLVHSWQMLGLITLVCVAAAWLVLYIGFNRKKG